MSEIEMTETADYDKSATPTDHASKHEIDGSDEIDATGLDHKVACRAYLSSSQSIPSATMTDLDYDAVAFDRGNDFNVSTHRFVAPTDGKYMCLASVLLTSLEDGDQIKPIFKINGAQASESQMYLGAAGNGSYPLATILDLAANDYVNVSLRHDNIASKQAYLGQGINYINVTRLY